MRVLIFISILILSCSKSKEIKKNSVFPETEKTETQ
jgi:hypothetical protein